MSVESPRSTTEPYNILPPCLSGLSNYEAALKTAREFLLGEEEWTDRLYSAIKRSLTLRERLTDREQLSTEELDEMYKTEVALHRAFGEEKSKILGAFYILWLDELTSIGRVTIEDP